LILEFCGKLINQKHKLPFAPDQYIHRHQAIV